MPELRPAARLAYALGLTLMLLLGSSLVALRGITMLGHIAAAKVEAGLNTVHPPLAHSHSGTAPLKERFEHCLLCFAQLVETSNAKDPIVKRLEITHLRQLQLYATYTRNQFFQTVAPRGPPILI